MTAEERERVYSYFKNAPRPSSSAPAVEAKKREKDMETRECANCGNLIMRKAAAYCAGCSTDGAATKRKKDKASESASSTDASSSAIRAVKVRALLDGALASGRISAGALARAAPSFFGAKRAATVAGKIARATTHAQLAAAIAGDGMKKRAFRRVRAFVTGEPNAKGSTSEKATVAAIARDFRMSTETAQRYASATSVKDLNLDAKPAAPTPRTVEPIAPARQPPKAPSATDSPRATAPSPSRAPSDYGLTDDALEHYGNVHSVADLRLAPAAMEQLPSEGVPRLREIRTHMPSLSDAKGR